MPVDGGLGALAGDRIEPGRCCDGEMACVGGDEDRGGEGCSQADSAPATKAMRASSVKPPTVWISVRTGFPAAMVPVLSNERVPTSFLQVALGLTTSMSVLDRRSACTIDFGR